MKGMGPEAALLSARLAEIHALRDQGRAVRDGDRSIYVEAAVSGRRGATARPTGGGGWAGFLPGWLAPSRRRPVDPVAVAAIPTALAPCQLGEEDRGYLAVLPSRSGPR